jgi:hypothetical protein
MTGKHFARLFGFSMALVVVCIGAGLFTASEFYRRTLALNGATERVEYILMFQVCSSLLWAALVPIVIFVAERLPLRQPHLLRNGVILIVFLPLFAIARAALGGAVMNLCEGNPVSLKFIDLSISIRTHRNIAIEAVIILVTNLLLAQREAAQRRQREADAQTLLARAKLDQLRAQFQPHFVFTTLQAIADTIERDAGEADRMIVTLAELLRRSLAAGGQPVPLADELEFVDRSAALYGACAGGQRSMRFDAGDDVLDARVPALFVQQLVDKAGDANDVAVRAWRDGAELRVEVSGAATVAASIPWEGVP